MNLAYRCARGPAVPALLLALALAAAPARAAQETIDRGSYEITVNGRSVGRELFHVFNTNDSLVVTSSSTFRFTTPDGEKETKKLLNVVLGREDLVLRGYTSNEEFDGHVRIRGVVMSSETAITLIHEFDGRGYGNTYERPAGRVFVLEGQLFALMNLIAHAVRDQSFDRRPVNLISLAARDTISEAEVVRLPPQTIRWGNKPVQAEHLQLVQAPLVFDLWLDRAGRVLRIEHVPSGLRVEREAPAVKPRGKSSSSSG